MMQTNSVVIKLNEFAKNLDSIDKKILIDFPVADYVRSIKNIPITRSYSVIPKKIKKKIDIIKLKYGQEAIAIYQKLTLVFLIQESLSVFQNDGYSPDVKSFYRKCFEWIFEDFNTKDSSYYDYSNDLFLKDLNICSLRMFPAGSQYVELSTLNWRFILRSIRYGGLNQGSLAKFFEASRFYLTEVRREVPFYETHTDGRWLAEFSKTGWHKFYLRIAEMLELNPQIQGMTGTSWFYDPALETISPNLLYLREVPEQAGAKVFKFGSTDLDIKHATAVSQKRRKLYEEGQYLPTSYTLIWLRDDLIKWANESA